MATTAPAAAGKADTLPTIDLKRPHGFLVWKGKQTAIAGPSPYDHTTPYLITSDGEAFGVVTLGEAAQMNVAEFDNKAWRDVHRYNPEERRRFWPEANVFYVQTIKSWEGFNQSRPYENGQIVECDFSDEEADLIERSRGLPKQITLQADAVVLSGGKFVLAEGIAPALLEASLKAAYEVDPEFSSEAADSLIPLYRLALVREPRPMVKKKSEPATQEKQIGEMMPYRISERGEQVCVVKTDTGEAEECYSGPMAMEDAQALLSALNMNVMAEEESEMDHGGGGLLDRLRAARDALASVMAMMRPEPMAPMEMPEAEMGYHMFTSPFGVMVKEVDGKPWHVTWSTNAFEDREKEIFSTKALETYVDHSMKADDRGTFDYWHIPGTDFAKKEFQAVIGRFLLEAGPYFDNEVGQKAMVFFKEYPVSHPEFAPEGWGSSPQYLYLPEDRADGVYDWLWFPKTSTLPRAKAANVWTEAKQEQVMTKLTDEQIKSAKRIWGEELFNQMVTFAEQKSKDLEAAGVAFKDAGTPTPAEETPPPTTTDADDKPAQPAEIEIDEAGLQVIAATIGKQFTADVQPLAENIDVLTQAVKSILERMDVLEGKKRAKEMNETPRFVFSMKRATEAEETVVQSDDGLKEKKPKDKTEHVEGSMASAYFKPK